MKSIDRTATLSNYVYEKLLERINNEEFSEGARLPTEEVLSKQYGVSRPVVREALAMLRDNGYIQSRRGAGSFLTRIPATKVFAVTPIQNLTDVQRCYEFRYALEGEIAYRAATRHDATDMKSIQKAYDAQLTKSTKPGVAQLEVDLNFHLCIAKATHNRFFYEALQAIHQQMLNSMKLIALMFDNPRNHLQVKIDQHAPILQALQAGDPDAARLNMQLHIIHSRDLLFKK